MRMDSNFLRYSGLDSACTKEVHDGFWDELAPTFTAANDMTMNILPVLMFMQSRGILVNHDALNKMKVDITRTAAERQEELNALCGRTLNVQSPKDCQAYFYNELGIPPYKNKEGNPTVDDLALQRLVRGTVARPGLRQAKLVQDIRGLKKLYGTYLDIEFDSDSRMRCSYNPRGTKFGRLSSSKTIFSTGTNMQNLPDEFKAFLVPDPGYVFLELDKRQAEWVVVAYLTGDANMLTAIEQGIDVHTHTACEMFHVDKQLVKMEHKLCQHTTDSNLIEEIRHSNLDIVSAMRDSGKKWPRSMSLRQCGKKSNHGLNYDEGPNGFALINEIDQAEARRIVDMYHSIYPGIRIWYESIKRQLSKDRLLTNCFGRSIRFLDAWGDSLFKSAYSALPQSTVVDSLNQGMEAIYEDAAICGIEGANADILAQVHDSVLLQVPIAWIRQEHNFKYLLERLTDYTSPLLRYSGREFQIATDYKFGMNWGGYDPDRNPGGMQEMDEYTEFMKALEVWEKPSGERALELA